MSACTDSRLDSIYRFPLQTIYEGLDQFSNQAGLILQACIKNNQTIPKVQNPFVSKYAQYFKSYN